MSVMALTRESALLARLLFLATAKGLILKPLEVEELGE